MEVFLGLKPSPLGAVPRALRLYRDRESINAERCRQIADIRRTCTVLEQMHKALSNSNEKRHTQAQKTDNSKIEVLPINIDIVDYVMVRTHAKPSHKL